MVGLYGRSLQIGSRRTRSDSAEELLESAARDVVEDEIGLGVGDSRMPGQVLEDEVAQLGRVARRHVQQEVVDPAHVEQREHAGPVRRLPAKAVDLLPG